MTAAPVPVQVRVLTERYVDRMLGDPWTLLLLVGQAPIIGWLCTVVWGSVERDTPSLWFVLVLSAVWLGCVSACREVVRDRQVVERERLFGLSMGAWIASRYRVLGLLGAVQVALLLGTVEASLALRGPLGVQALSLWLASLAGTGLGLAVSALASSQERAVGAVPLLVLPQILFSEVAVPRAAFGSAVAWGEWLMPVSWSYAVFVEGASPDRSWLALLGYLGAQAGFAAALGLAAWLAVLPRREVA